MDNFEKFNVLAIQKGSSGVFILSHVLWNLETWVYSENVFKTPSLLQNSRGAKIWPQACETLLINNVKP